MFAPYLSSLEQIYTNVGAPSATPGTSITPGASNAEGSWTQVASSGNIADDVFWVRITVHGGSSSATAKNHLLDIGVDPAGGTSYTAVISNIVCGSSGTLLQGGRVFVFPMFIKAGSSVAVRVQGSAGTAGTLTVSAWFMGTPSRPEMERVGRFSETVGTITNSNGVSFTPGDSAAEGSWTSLGTTSSDLWWWQVGVQIDNGGMTNGHIYQIDLAYGDASNKIMILENIWMLIPATTEIIVSSEQYFAYRDVPAGSTIYIRGSCSGTASTGCNAVAIGIGG